MRWLLLFVTIFVVTPFTSFAVDQDLGAELERIANGSTDDARGIAVELQNTLFAGVSKSCEARHEITHKECMSSRLADALDGSGLLTEQCGALKDEGARIACVVGGAEALLLVAALEGNPREDIDWTDALGSFANLLGRFKEAARRRCAMVQETVEPECIVKEQAVMLGFPTKVGLACASKAGRSEKQSCLGALQIIAVYLQAMKRILDPTRPL